MPVWEKATIAESGRVTVDENGNDYVKFLSPKFKGNDGNDYGQIGFGIDVIGEADNDPSTIIGSFGGLKQIATRSQIINSGGFNSGATTIMTTSVHTTRDAVTSLRLAFANWYVDTGDGKEKGTGGLLTLKASIEYSGVFYPLKQGGSSEITIPSGYTAILDDCSVTIPDNTAFKVHVLQSNPAGILYVDNASASFGDRLSFDSTDRTGTGGVPNDLPGYSFPPCLILGSTSKRSAIGYSDSRFYGSGDTADASGDVGIFARGTGPQIAYCCAGVPSDRDDWFLANSVRRRALADAFSDVVVGFGVNGSITVAERIVNVAAIYALFSGQRVHGVTSSPHTSGAIANADGSDQTAVQDLSTYNTAVKAKPAGMVSYFDCAYPVSIVAAPTKWKNNCVADSGGIFIHENATGAKATMPYVDYGCPRPSGNLLSANQSKLIGWSAGNATLTNGVLAGPDGATTISTLVENSTTNTHGAEVGVATSVPAGTYEYSVLVKRMTGVGRDLQLFLFDGAFSNSLYAGFDLAAGSVNVAATINSGTKFSAAYARVVPVEDGFYRVTLGFTADGSTTNFQIYTFPMSAGQTNYAGNGASGLYLGQADIRKVA